MTTVITLKHKIQAKEEDGLSGKLHNLQELDEKRNRSCSCSVWGLHAREKFNYQSSTLMMITPNGRTMMLSFPFFL